MSWSRFLPLELQYRQALVASLARPAEAIDCCVGADGPRTVCVVLPLLVKARLVRPRRREATVGIAFDVATPEHPETHATLASKMVR